MQESTWLTSTHPSRMLNELKVRRPTSGARKCHLFSVACCRRIWDLLVDPRSRRAVEAVERFTKGYSTAEELQLYGHQAQIASWDHPEVGAVRYGVEAVAQAISWDTIDHRRFTMIPRSPSVADPHLIARASGAAYHAAYARGSALHPEGQGQAWLDAIRAEEVAQADLVREVFGNVYRPVELDPSWRTPKVVDLARGIDQSKDFDGLPALGDALEESGCDRADFLEHCRGPGPHVPGCWALDAVLGPWIGRIDGD